jgi:cytochrome oxidase Cu insertion factor (SCO1/SenC/PrrC family)
MPRRPFLSAPCSPALLAAGPAAAHDGRAASEKGERAGRQLRLRAARARLLQPAGDQTGGRRPGSRRARGGSHDLADLVRGQVTVLAFIYTQCADVCPTATLRLAAARPRGARPGHRRAPPARHHELRPRERHPRRDARARRTVARARRRQPEWLFLTAPDAASLAPILAAYDQTVGRKPDPNDPTGALNHILRVFLIDAEGTGAQHLQPRFPRPQPGAERRAHAADGAQRRS